MRYTILASVILLSLSSLTFAGREDDYNFARKLYNDGYYDLAAEQYAKFIQLYPDDARLPFAYYMRGQSLTALGQWDEARIAFLRVGLDYPDSKYAPEAYYRAAQCLNNLEKPEPAARGFMLLADYYPGSEFAAKGMFEAGLIYLEIAKEGEAWSAFERIITLYPATAAAANAYYALAEIAERRGSSQDALIKYDLARRTSEDPIAKGKAALRRATIYYRIGEWDLAETELTQVQNPPELVKYGDMLRGLWMHWRGDFKGAELTLKRVYADAVSDTLKSITAFYIGDNCFQMGNYAEALEFYNLAPESDSLNIRRGLTLMKIGSVSAAVKAFSQVLESEGDTDNKIIALEQLVELYRQGAKSAEVSSLIASYSDKLKNLPRWDRFAANIGIIAFEEGNFGTAADFLNQVEAVKSPWSDDAHYYLARLAEARQDTQSAFALYENFSERYPGSDYADEAKRNYLELKNSLPVRNLIQQLAELSAASMNMQNKGKLALEWGKLYLNGFKDYPKACEQFAAALQSPELSPQEHTESLGLLAKSLAKRTQAAPPLADSTFKVMHRYLDTTEKGDLSGEFSLYILHKQVSAISGSIEADKVYLNGLADMLTRYPNDKIIPQLLVEMADVSLKLNDPSKAIAYSNRFERQYPVNEFTAEALFIRAQADLKLKNETGALQDLKKYRENYPHGPRIFSVSRELANLEKSPDRKIAELRRIIDQYYYHSEIPQIMEEIADLYLNQGENSQALAAYQLTRDMMLTSMPLGGKTEIEYKFGIAYRRLGEIGKAQEAFLRYAVDNPEGKHWSEALFALAEISEAQGRAPAALKFYQNLISHTGDVSVNRAAVERMAEVYYRVGNYSEGRKLYLNLAERESDKRKKMKCEAQAIVGLYRQDLLENARQEAVEFAKKYAVYSELSEYQAEFYLEKGKSQARQKSFEEALKTLNYAETKYRNSSHIAAIKYELGKTYLTINEFEKALDILTGVVEKYPDDEIIPAVYLSLGTFYYRQRQFQNALLAFQEVLDNPAAEEYHSLALKNLEATYKDIGLYEAALSMVNRYMERYPYAEDILLKKIDAAQILINLREYDRAIERLQALLPQTTPELRLEVQFYLGEAYFRKGDFQQAILEYMKVKYLDPGTGMDWAVTAIYNTGQCYEKLGQYEEAKKMYQKIVEQYGANTDYGRGAQQRIDFIDQKQKH